MQVILGRSNTIGSAAIRLYTWSVWSHAGVVIGDKVIEATASHGVVESELSDFKSRYTSHKIVNIAHKDGYEERARAQIGKSYDWGAIVRFVTRVDWDKKDKWFCFELVAYASGVYNSDYLNRVTATHLLMLSD